MFTIHTHYSPTHSSIKVSYQYTARESWSKLRMMQASRKYLCFDKCHVIQRQINAESET